MTILQKISNFYYIQTDILKKAISQPLFFYKRIVIKQKNGKKRVVFSPNSTVKMCQNFVLKHYLEKLTYSEFAFAYTRKKSILDCAKLHVGNTHFLHIDIKHFFDNMTWSVFCRVIKDCYSNTEFARILEDENDTLKMILCMGNIFCQGAVTSPYISNIVLSNFDVVMNEYVSKNFKSGKYSRYSDDIYISSKCSINENVIRYIKDELKKYGLRINYKKVRFTNLNDSTNMLGLTLTKDNRIVLNTKMKSKIKSMIYQYLKNPSESCKNKIIGYVYYVMMVDQKFYTLLKKKYDMSKLM